MCDGARLHRLVDANCSIGCRWIRRYVQGCCPSQTRHKREDATAGQQHDGMRESVTVCMSRMFSTQPSKGRGSSTWSWAGFVRSQGERPSGPTAAKCAPRSHAHAETRALAKLATPYGLWPSPTLFCGRRLRRSFAVSIRSCAGRFAEVASVCAAQHESMSGYRFDASQVTLRPLRFDTWGRI